MCGSSAKCYWFALDVDPSFVEPDFMSEYEATFGDEHVEDSVVD
jgi:hypothetical protein